MQALGDEIHQRLECAPLLVAVVGPERPEARLARLRGSARRRGIRGRPPQRVALHVEEDIAGRWGRESLKATARRRFPQFECRPAFDPPPQLHCRLGAQFREGRLRHSRDRRGRAPRRQRFERHHTGRLKLPDLRARDARNEPQMVIRQPLIIAALAPSALLALRTRLRIGVQGRGSSKRSQCISQPPEVARIVGVAERTLGSVAEHDRHRSRIPPLHFRDQPAIEAQLQHVARLRLASELRVENFVAPATQSRRLVDAPQEVGSTEPAWELQSCLEDDRCASMHRLDRLRHLDVARARARYFDEIGMRGSQATKIGLFPGVTLLLQQQQLSIGGVFRHRLIEVAQLERGQVLATQVIDHIRCGQHERSVASVHVNLSPAGIACAEPLQFGIRRCSLRQAA